jgi:hypothetical protein
LLFVSVLPVETFGCCLMSAYISSRKGIRETVLAPMGRNTGLATLLMCQLKNELKQSKVWHKSCFQEWCLESCIRVYFAPYFANAVTIKPCEYFLHEFRREGFR